MSSRHSRRTLGSLIYRIAFHLLRSAAILPISPRHARSRSSQA